MNSNTGSDLLENVQLSDAVGTLFDELNLAFQWHKSSCMMAVFNSPSIQTQAMTSLATSLLSTGYAVYPVDAAITKATDFERALENDMDDDGVYFIENFSLSMDQPELNLWRSFIYQRDAARPKLSRLVFWVSETELVGLVQKFPDFWENRYRVIDLTTGGMNVTAQESHAEQAGLNGCSAQANPAPDAESMAVLFEREAREFLRDGKLELEQGDYYNACQYLQNAADLADVVQDTSLQVESQHALALAHASLRNHDLAVEAYQKILELSPKNGLAWNNLGNLFLQFNDVPKALEAFQQAIELDQNDSVSWEGIARVYHKYGLIEKAIGCYHKAIDLTPDFANAWEGLGNIFMELDKVDMAVRAYQKVIANDPARISTWIRFAQIYAGRGKKSDAIAILQKAVELYPTEIQLWVEIGNLHLNCADGVAAVDAFTKALEICPRHGLAYCKLAEAQEMVGNIPVAISCYELGIGFIDDSQQHAVSLQNLLALKASQGASPAAGLTVEASTNPVRTFAPQEQLVIVEPAVATMAAQAAVEEPDMQAPNSTYWNELGNTHFTMGNYDQAIQAYLAAIEASPQDFWPYVHNLATAYLHKEKMAGQASQEDQDLAADVPDQVEMQAGDVQTTAGFIQQPSEQEMLEKVSMTDSYSNNTAQVHKEMPGKSERSIRHLNPIWVEGPGVKAAKSTCPQPVRNSKEWALYLKYSEPILSSWTQHERNKLLMDAFLEQPRAEMPYSRNVAEQRLSETGMPRILAADASYEKNKFVAKKESLLDVPAHTSNEEDEKWAQAWIRQGNFLVRKGAYEDAATAFSMAISLAPNLGSTYNSLGLVYFHQERYQDALSQFLKSVELITDPKEKANSWNYLGDAYRRLHDEAHALQAYEKAGELNKNGSPLKWRARHLILSNCR